MKQRVRFSMTRRLLAAVVLLCFSARSAEVIDHFNSSLQLQLDLYPRDPGDAIVTDATMQDDPLNASFLFSWDTWADFGSSSRLNAAGWIEAGVPYSHRWTGGVDLWRNDAYLCRPVVFSELYTTGSSGPFDFSAGRMIRRNTVSVLFPLADRYVVRDYTDPFEVRMLGSWQARVDCFLGHWETSLAVFPFFQPSTLPGLESRWAESTLGVSFPGTVGRGLPDATLDNAGVSFSVKGHPGGFDLFSTLYHGLSPYGVSRLRQPEGRQDCIAFEYVPAFEYSAGVSTEIHGFEFHGEGMYHRTSSGRDDDYVHGLIGFLRPCDTLADWLSLNQVQLAVEYAREHVLNEQDSLLGYISSSMPYRFGRDTLFSRLLVDFSESNSAECGVIYNFSEESHQMRIGAGHRFSNGNRVSLTYNQIGGRELWAHNDRITLMYEISF